MTEVISNIDYRVRYGQDYSNPEWLRCSISYEDRKTKVINKLIHGLFKDDILSKNSNLGSLYLIRNYDYRYTLVFEINRSYNNESILISALLTSVDKILEWWDIPKRNNLDVEFVIRGHRSVCKNYYQLMWDIYIKRYSGFGNGIDNTHPRFEGMCRWMYEHNYHEYNAGMNRSYDPYRYEEHPQAQELIRQREQFIGRGIPRGELNVIMDGQDFYQQSLGIQRGDFNQYIDSRLQREIPVELPIERQISTLTRLKNKLNIRW